MTGDLFQAPAPHDPGGKVRIALPAFLAATATAAISPCGRYRTVLRREWDVTLPPALWCGMNPSTADHTHDDPTCQRERGHTARFGCGRYWKVNVMDLRATKPKDLRAPGAVPRSDLNLPAIRALAAETRAAGGIVIACWGALPRPLLPFAGEALDALRAGGPVLCLGRTLAGHPRHPLYLKGDTPLEAFA